MLQTICTESDGITSSNMHNKISVWDGALWIGIIQGSNHYPSSNDMGTSHQHGGTMESREEGQCCETWITPTSIHPIWDFMLEGMLDMVKRGYWTILPYLTIKRLSGLKISLAGVVPQCARQLRPIIDYLFLAINQTTLWVVFGGDAVQPCFKCILENVTYANPCFGPVKVIKINLANGYYQVPVQHMWFFGSRSHLTNVCSECTHCITANTPHGLVRITPILLHVYRDHHGYFK